jgi:hypothetical protein
LIRREILQAGTDKAIFRDIGAMIVACSFVMQRAAFMVFTRIVGLHRAWAVPESRISAT